MVNVDDETMLIRYDDGNEVRQSIEIKARIFENIIGEQQLRHPWQNKDYFQSLGFMSKRAEFHAEVPPQSRARFEEHYRLFTGLRPLPHENKYFPIETDDNYQKWGPELRIYIPVPANFKLVLPPEVLLRSSPDPGVVRINSNDFWWQLVRVGFRLGSVHKIQSIVGSVPKEYQSHFRSGMAKS